MNRIGSSRLRWDSIKLAEVRPHFSGKTVIVGHTPQVTGEILDLGFLIAIDTNCFRGGWLTAIELNSMTVLQSDQESRTRTVIRRATEGRN